MDQIVAFFENPFFSVLGGVSTVMVIVTAGYSAYLVLIGVFPVLRRLGYGLSKRKIAVFADSEFDDLKAMLVDSKLFRAKNIVRITKGAIDTAEDISLLLMHWNAYKDAVLDILAVKKDQDALIVYAPQNEGRIDDTARDIINKKRNTIIVNFRGRLLNDVLTSMITTGYQQK